MRTDYSRLSKTELIDRILELEGDLQSFKAAEPSSPESSLSSENARIHAILENAVEGIITIDESGIIGSLNPAACRMFGYEPGELIGQNITILMPEPDRSRHDEYLSNYSETGKANIIGTSREVTGVRKDGSHFPMDLSISEFRLGSQRFFTGILCDVTQRKKAAEQLLQLAVAEKQLHLISTAVNEAHDAILITTAEKPFPKILYGNPAFCRLAHLSPEEVPGTPLDRLESGMISCFRRALAKGISLTGEDYLQRVNEEPRILESDIAPIHDESGEITHWVCIQRDITTRKQAEKALRQRVRQQAAIAHLGNRVLTGIPFDNLLAEIGELLVETVDTGFSQVMEILPDGQNLILRAGAGWRPGSKEHALSPIDNSPAGIAVTKGEPVLYEDLLNDPNLTPPPYLAEHGISSGIAVPIFDQGRAFGAIAVGTREARTFTHDDVHFLQAMANTVSVALSRQRAEKEILEGGTREQQRIGQDLHDGLGQHLTGIELLSHVLEEDLAENDLPQAAQAAAIASRVREAISQTRYLARGLSPVHVESDGLMRALDHLAKDITEIFKVRCVLHCPEPVLFKNPDTAAHLFRIAQEAVSNAIRHGHAKNLTITLRQENGRRHLEIDDDGTGFDGKSATTGIGLRIMKRRATVIGATLEILPKPENGVKIACTLPATV